MILQKFSYPLGATCFTEKECNSIQAKFLPTVLSKMGINRSTPREVCSGPSLYASMVVSELWPIQGSSTPDRPSPKDQHCGGQPPSRTRLSTIASWRIMGHPQQGRYPHSTICGQVLDITPVGIQ
jgi:hypothetical protein